MPLEQIVGEDPLYFGGDALTLQITVRNGDLPSSPPLDLTLFTDITWVLAKKQGAVALVTKTLAGGPGEINPVDLTNGRIDVIIQKPDTNDLAGEYYHELQLETSPNTPLFGAFIIQNGKSTP